MKKPYVGITGYKTRQEVKEAARLFKEQGFLEKTSLYRPMFGIAASNKRLADRRKGGTMSPSLDDIITLLREVPDYSLPVIHYATENRDKLAEELIEVFSTGHKKHAGIFSTGSMYMDFCNAVQINMDWPEIKQIEKTRDAMPRMAFIFQIPQKAMQAYTANNVLDIKAVAERAGEYSEFADYFLVDPSSGKGKEFDVSQCTELMMALKEKLPNARIGVAGGFSGDNVYEKMLKIHEKVKEPFSIDAQGRLRTEDREWLVMEKAQKYISEAGKATRLF